MAQVMRGLDIWEWRSLCHMIVRIRGVPLENGELEYKDSTICIQKHSVFKANEPALVLVRVSSNMPVFRWDFQGLAVDCHGEFGYVQTHILSLAIQIFTEGLSGESVSLS